MNIYKDRPPSPLDRYRMHGDTRPRHDYLETYLAHMHPRSLSLYLTMADMCIDMACARPESADDMIQAAGGHLETVIHDTYALKARGNLPAFSIATPHAVMAILRRCELSNWYQAALGQDVTNSYEAYLMAAHEAEALCGFDATAKSRVSEFVPVLLSSRAQWHDARTGGLGRLALDREGFRPVKQVGSPNWDCGITDDMHAQSYQSPQYKLEVKATKRSAVNSSPRELLRRHNVTKVIAQIHDFDNPGPIIAGCLREFGSLSDDLPAEPMSPVKLDAITQGIARYVGYAARKDTL